MAMLELDARPLRPLGAAMLGVAVAWPILPVHLPPCPLLSLTGIPCPFCGATRSVVALVQGDPAASLLWNPLGLLSALVAVALLVGWVMKRGPARLAVPVWLPLAAVGATWVYNLTLNPNF